MIWLIKLLLVWAGETVIRCYRKLADIAPLLDVEDMVRMKDKPDWKCVFTYVQSFYRRFAMQPKQSPAETQHHEEKKKEEEKQEETAEKTPSSDAVAKTEW